MNGLLLSLLVTAPSAQIRVDGEGLLRFTRNGRTVYARSATLTSVQGRLAFRDAYVLPTIAVAEGADFVVSPDGTVTVAGRIVGRFVLAKFPSDATLAENSGFLTSTVRPTLGSPGLSGLGQIITGGTAPPRVPVAVSSNATSPQIVVRGESMVDTKTFTLADIADIRLPSNIKSQIGAVVVGDTPPLGLDRRIDRDRLLVRLRVSGFDPNSLTIEVPTEAVVRRPSQKVEHERLFEAAKVAIQRLTGPNSQITDLNPLPPLVIGVGTVTLNPVNPTVTANKASVRVEVLLNGQVTNSRTIQLAIAGALPLPKVGDMVAARARYGGVKVTFTAKVTAVRGPGQIEITTLEGEKLTGVLVEPGTVEINL